MEGLEADECDGVEPSLLSCLGAVAGVPVIMSASQSPSPPGAASIAVCGLYTLMPSPASRRSDCC